MANRPTEIQILKQHLELSLSHSHRSWFERRASKQNGVWYFYFFYVSSDQSDDKTEVTSCEFKNEYELALGDLANIETCC